MNKFEKAYKDILAEEVHDTASKTDFVEELANLLSAHKASISIDTDAPPPTMRLFIGETDSEGIDIGDQFDDIRCRKLLEQFTDSSEEE